LLETKEAKMKLRIFGQRIKVNGKAIEKSSKNYIVNGELISTEEEPGPSDAPGAEDDQNSGSPGSSTNPAPTKNPNEEWRLVWSDEFNGSEINMANWSYDDPTNGRWNGKYNPTHKTMPISKTARWLLKQERRHYGTKR